MQNHNESSDSQKLFLQFFKNGTFLNAYITLQVPRTLHKLAQYKN